MRRSNNANTNLVERDDEYVFKFTFIMNFNFKEKVLLCYKTYFLILKKAHLNNHG